MSDLPFDLPNDLIDIQEQANEVDFLTPRDYARLKGVAPQMIYYHIRTGTLETFHCACGRKVLDVKESNDRLQAKEETRRSKLGRRHSCPTID